MLHLLLSPHEGWQLPLDPTHRQTRFHVGLACDMLHLNCQEELEVKPELEAQLPREQGAARVSVHVHQYSVQRRGGSFLLRQVQPATGSPEMSMTRLEGCELMEVSGEEGGAADGLHEVL